MQINNLPFGTTDWSSVEATTHMGDTGVDSDSQFVMRNLVRDDATG